MISSPLSKHEFKLRWEMESNAINIHLTLVPYLSASLIANFMLLPLTLEYLDAENYGVWLTLSAFIGWFAIFDIGLGNGLRNKFAEAKTNGNFKKAKSYVSTAYLSISFNSELLKVRLF